MKDRPTVLTYARALSRIAFTTLAYGLGGISTPEQNHRAKAMSWARIGAYRRAAGHLQQYLANNLEAREESWARAWLAWCYSELGLFAAAVEQYRLAYACSKRPEIALRLAYAEVDHGNRDAANELYAEVSARGLELDSEAQSALANLRRRLDSAGSATLIPTPTPTAQAASILVPVRKRRLRTAALWLIVVGTSWATLVIYSVTGSRTIYLVPLEAEPELLQSLQRYYREQLGIHVRILPSVQLQSSAWDSGREQLIAENVIDLIYKDHWLLRWPNRTIVIGITSVDMYIEKMPWYWAFSYRERGRSAIVSYARMDPEAYGQPPDLNILETRLRKMVTRNIGWLQYRLQKTSDRENLMYQDINGVDDLDRVREDLRRAGFPVAGATSKGQ